MRSIRRAASAVAAALSIAASPIDGTFLRLDHGVARPSPAPDGSVLIYYGASWCGPCRAFLPELVAAYPRLRRRHIEVVFVADEGCGGALDYARAMRMPWLLLPCDPARSARLRRLGGAALPGLVLLDGEGRRAASSWRTDGSSTPRATLAQMVREMR